MTKVVNLNPDVDRARRVSHHEYDAIFACDGSFLRKLGGWSVASTKGHLLTGTLSKVRDASACELAAFLTALDYASDYDGRRLVVTDCYGLARLQNLSWSHREAFLMSLSERSESPTVEDRANGLDRWRQMDDEVEVVHIKAHQGFDHANPVEVLHAVADRTSREAARGLLHDDGLNATLTRMDVDYQVA